MVRLICARSKNNIIGNGNELPWNIPEEMAFFKQMTTNIGLS